MLHLEGTGWLCAALVALSSGVLAGCTETEEPARLGLEADYLVVHPPAMNGQNVLAFYRYPTGFENLPDMDLPALVTLNGTKLDDVEFSGDGPSRRAVFRGSTPRIAAGERYTFLLDLPMQKGIESSIAMVSDGGIAHPKKGAEVSTAEALTVVWSPAASGEVDTLLLRRGDIEDSFELSHGVSQRTLDSFDLNAFLLDVPSPHGPVPAELVLRRTRTVRIEDGPPFVSSKLMVSADLDVVPIVLVP